jgi:Nitrile hydratase beta subunit/alpha/beta hydrolase fold
VLTGGKSPRSPLSSIIAPTLVIHGTADPMFPAEHGEALAHDIPDASLMRLDGAGHGIHPADRETIAAVIIDHTVATDRWISLRATGWPRRTARVSTAANETRRYDPVVERAVHDRGGWPTDAPIDRTEHQLADWELLTDALMGALAGKGLMRVDELRRGIESMPPAEYERASYYERWLYSIETILTEKRVLAPGEVDRRLVG